MPRTTILIASLAIAVLLNSGYAKAEGKLDASLLTVGSHCELRIKESVSENERYGTEYLGTVKELSEKSVTLHDVTQTVRTERSTPVLSSIPYVKRYFTNVGIGRIHLGEKTVVIPLKDIAWNETVTADEFRMRSEIPRKNVVRRQGDNVP